MGMIVPVNMLFKVKLILNLYIKWQFSLNRLLNHSSLAYMLISTESKPLIGECYQNGMRKIVYTRIYYEDYG